MERKVLIVFNLQNKFVNEENEFVIKHINKLLFENDLIIFIQKIDDKDIINYDDDFHDDLEFTLCKRDFYIFKDTKNSNSIFNIKGLKEFLDERDVTDIHICGISINKDIQYSSRDSLFHKYNTSIIYSKL